jgi:hypothetical protein
MTSTATVWHGGRGGPAALRPGREVIARVGSGGLGVDRVWVDIGRVTGTILACERNTVEVDMGPHRGHTSVMIPPHALGRVLVRHPRLEPGYLIDVICVRSPDGPQAARPGTSQPGYRPGDLASPGSDAPVPDVLRGTVTWFGGATYEPRADDRPRLPDASARRTAAASPTGEDTSTGEAVGAGRARPESGTGVDAGPISPDAMAWPELGRGSFFGAAAKAPRGDGYEHTDEYGAERGRRSPHRSGPRHASSARKSPGWWRTPSPRSADRDTPDARARKARPGAGPAYLLTGEYGAAYPFIDPEGDAGACPDTPAGCVALPYLSMGSELTLHNECADTLARIPVIECGCVAARYCDRCVECGTSPRGRLAELTPAAFVALGGDLDAGCFNAALRFDAALRNEPPRQAEG